MDRMINPVKRPSRKRRARNELPLKEGQAIAESETEQSAVTRGNPPNRE